MKKIFTIAMMMMVMTISANAALSIVISTDGRPTVHATYSTKPAKPAPKPKHPHAVKPAPKHKHMAHSSWRDAAHKNHRCNHHCHHVR